MCVFIIFIFVFLLFLKYLFLLLFSSKRERILLPTSGLRTYKNYNVLFWCGQSLLVTNSVNAVFTIIISFMNAIVTIIIFP